MPSGEREPWFQEGLKFSCSQCGNCCTGGPGAVWYTEEEGAAMAKALGISLDEFTRSFTRSIGSRRSLNETQTEFGFDCVFLDRDTRPGVALCKVYMARPAQCSTWPFWKDNLRSKAAWAQAKARTPCPGMDHGTLVPVDRIRVMRDLDNRDNGSAPW